VHADGERSALVRGTQVARGAHQIEPVVSAGVVAGLTYHQPTHRVPDQVDAVQRHGPTLAQTADQLRQFGPVLGDRASGVVAQHHRGGAELGQALAVTAAVLVAVPPGLLGFAEAVHEHHDVSGGRGMRLGQQRGLVADDLALVMRAKLDR